MLQNEHLRSFLGKFLYLCVQYISINCFKVQTFLFMDQILDSPKRFPTRPFLSIVSSFEEVSYGMHF